MGHGRLTTEQEKVLQSYVQAKVVFDLGAGDCQLASLIYDLGAAHVVAIEKENMLSLCPDEIEGRQMRFSELADELIAQEETIDVSFISWPINRYMPGLNTLIQLSQTVIYLGSNTSSNACAGPRFFQELLYREVVAYVPDRKNTLIVYGDVLDSPRNLSEARGEEFAGLTIYQQEKPMSFEEAESRLRENPHTKLPPTMASLPPMKTGEELRTYLGRNRDIIEPLSQEIKEINDSYSKQFDGMTTLYHGTTNAIATSIKEHGFQLMMGERSGFMGASIKVQNLAIFLSNDKATARAFGVNRDSHAGRDMQVLTVKADIHDTLDLRKWGANIPLHIRKLAMQTINDYTGNNQRKPRQDDVFWILDQPEIVKAIQDAGFDSAIFTESRATRKYLDILDTSSDTIAVFDIDRLHIMKLPLRTLQEYVDYINQRSTFNVQRSLGQQRYRRNSDRETRQFERQSNSGDQQAEAALLARKIRQGQLDPRRVELAAILGHPASLQLFHIDGYTAAMAGGSLSRFLHRANLDQVFMMTLGVDYAEHVMPIWMNYEKWGDTDPDTPLLAIEAARDHIRSGGLDGNVDEASLDAYQTAEGIENNNAEDDSAYNAARAADTAADACSEFLPEGFVDRRSFIISGVARTADYAARAAEDRETEEAWQRQHLIKMLLA